MVHAHSRRAIDAVVVDGRGRVGRAQCSGCGGCSAVRAWRRLPELNDNDCCTRSLALLDVMQRAAV